MAKKKAKNLARQDATRMDKAYFDQRSAAEEALAIVEAAADDAARALADAQQRYYDGDESC